MKAVYTAAKLRPAGGAHPVAYGDDSVKIIVFNEPRHLSLAFPANYPEFPDGCFRYKLMVIVNILKVLVDCSHIFLE